jgi:MFS family permease
MRQHGLLGQSDCAIWGQIIRATADHSDSRPPNAAPAGNGWRSPQAAWTVVVLLTVGNMLAFFHRLVITLLAEPIKAEFALTDTALGLLIGAFFTASYVVAVIPIARLADGGNRARIIAVCVLVWSALTSLCLFARSYAFLALMRIGVGAAESGFGPASASLLADYFPPRTLAKAMGCFMAGVYLGGGLAMLGGGWLATTFAPAGRYELWIVGVVSGWKLILFVAGLPGIAFGALLLLVPIREPRQCADSARLAAESAASATAAPLWRSPVHIGLIGGLTLMIFVGNATGSWIPTLFQRAHGWSTADVGLRYGAAIVVCGTLGAIGGGWLASRLRGRGHPAAHLVIMFGCFAALTPVTVAFPLMADPRWALALIGLMNVLAAGTLGVGYALLQEVTPVGMRARVAGVNALAANVIGGALGPLTVALFTDHVFGDPARLPEAISATAALGSVLACLLLWTGIRPLWRARGR